LFFGVPQILPTPEVSNQPQATSNQKAKLNLYKFFKGMEVKIEEYMEKIG